MLQKKSFLFLTSICILLVVWLITMIHCRMPDQTHSVGEATENPLSGFIVTSSPAELVVLGGLRPLCEGYAFAKQQKPSDQEGMANDTDTNKINACFDDRTGNMLQSCKNKINDFATNLGQMNKKDLDSAYNSYVNEGGCFDKTSGQMLQPCKDAINHFATNFTQITKSDVDNGCGIRSVAVR